MSFPIQGLLQMLYYKLKNRRRAKMFREWAKGLDLQFAAEPKEFVAPTNPAPEYDASHLGRHSAKAIGIFKRLIGMSKIQSSYPQFASNRLRGEWQSDKNITWGTYRGRTIVVWDTVYYDLDIDSNSTDWSEGEYTSIMILTDTPIQPTLITPNTLAKRLSAFGIEEGKGMFSMSTVEFELDDFNKAYRVKSKDKKWAFAIIDQEMMEWLLKQKTAYEIHERLVGSEMCIRDRFGTTGMNVVTRMMGLLMLAVAMEFLTGGIAEKFPALVGTSAEASIGAKADDVE